MSRFSPAQVLADNAGLTLQQVAKRSGVSSATIRRYASAGRANAYRAARLAHILGCDPAIFLFGYSQFEKVVGSTKRNSHQPATIRRGDADTVKGASRRSRRTNLTLI